MRPEEGDVEVTGAPGYGGDEVDTRGQVRLGVESGHLATPGLVAPTLRTYRERDINTGLQHQQHLQRGEMRERSKYGNLNPSHD